MTKYPSSFVPQHRTSRSPCLLCNRGLPFPFFSIIIFSFHLRRRHAAEESFQFPSSKFKDASSCFRSWHKESNSVIRGKPKSRASFKFATRPYGVDEDTGPVAGNLPRLLLPRPRNSVASKAPGDHSHVQRVSRKTPTKRIHFAS